VIAHKRIANIDYVSRSNIPQLAVDTWVSGSYTYVSDVIPGLAT
jgi:hypothetical protein